MFWSIATVSVFAGQLYVGTGYREMANQQKAFAQVIYDQQMGWGARQQAEEMKANRPLNQTGEYE